MAIKGKTWFGTRGQEAWVPTPAINPEYSRAGYSSGVSQGINGMGFLRESKSAHNVYVLSWPVTKTRDAIRLITDFADGVFDMEDGVNLIYWIDPMAADKNVLCQGWATPSLATEDGVPLLTNADGHGRPKAVPTPPNSNRYPARSAQYTITPTSLPISQYIPIPPGFSAWVGIHGDVAAAGALRVQPVNGLVDAGSAITPDVLPASTTIRVNTEISSLSAAGIVLEFAPVLSSTVFTLYGLIVQILPTGQIPANGDFISGQGNSGCQFVGKPAKTPYSAKLDKVGATARLEETGMGR